jgi:importin subunit alpha-2
LSLYHVGINSGEESKEMTATHAARKILTRECEPPIDILINANVVPRLVEFLSRVNKYVVSLLGLQTFHHDNFCFSPHLQLESARALTHIVLGTSNQTKAVVSAGAVAGFVSLLGSPHPVVAEQAVRALGNIARDEPELKRHITEQGALNPLINLIKPDTSVSHFYINLCEYLKIYFIIRLHYCAV